MGHALLRFRGMLGGRVGVGTTVAIAAALLVVQAAPAATLTSGFDQQTLVSGLSRPTAAAWAPDGRMLVASKDGRCTWSAPAER